MSDAGDPRLRLLRARAAELGLAGEGGVCGRPVAELACATHPLPGSV